MGCFLLAEQQVQSCKACDTGHNVPMDEFLKLGTEYRYHLIDDLPGKVVGAFIQDPRRLCLRAKELWKRLQA